MSISTRIKLTCVVSSTIFWIPIIISFFQSKGFTLPEVYFLVSFFSMAVVVLEYPTGVFGDYFSHKLSVQLGHAISGVAMFLSVFNFHKPIYFLLLLLLALGATLVSGSDVALLYKHSPNFKKDLSDIKYQGMVALLFGTTVGGFLGNYNLTYPVILTAISFFIASSLLLGVPNSATNSERSGNIFSHLKDGLNSVHRTKGLLPFLTIGVFLGAMILSIKWFYNPMFEYTRIPTYLWGILVSCCIALTAIGAFITRKNIALNSKILAILPGVAMVAIGLTNITIVVLGALFLYSFLHGLFEVSYETELNNRLSNNHRASILSLKSLLTRVLYALHSFLAGWVLGYLNVLTFLSLTGIFLVATVTIFGVASAKNNTVYRDNT